MALFGLALAERGGILAGSGSLVYLSQESLQSKVSKMRLVPSSDVSVFFWYCEGVAGVASGVVLHGNRAC